MRVDQSSIVNPSPILKLSLYTDCTAGHRASSWVCCNIYDFERIEFVLYITLSRVCCPYSTKSCTFMWGKHREQNFWSCRFPICILSPFQFILTRESSVADFNSIIYFVLASAKHIHIIYSCCFLVCLFTSNCVRVCIYRALRVWISLIESIPEVRTGFFCSWDSWVLWPYMVDERVVYTLYLQEE
jgi:hypothetical protein